MRTPPLPLTRAAILFKLLGDETRLRLLLTLAEHGTLSVSDLCVALGNSRHALSQQLALLRAGNVVRCRKDGQSHVYSLAAGHVRELLRGGAERGCEPAPSLGSSSPWWVVGGGGMVRCGGINRGPAWASPDPGRP
jgi:DNA-binding transcriptional ArsR family regulator